MTIKVIKNTKCRVCNNSHVAFREALFQLPKLKRCYLNYRNNEKLVSNLNLIFPSITHLVLDGNTKEEDIIPFISQFPSLVSLKYFDRELIKRK